MPGAPRELRPWHDPQADNPGGLHLTPMDKGVIYLGWSAFQSVLPIVNGGRADRFGFKRTPVFAVSLTMVGYVMVASLRDLPFVTKYASCFTAILVPATGVAFFKPGIQGTLACTLPRENSSVDWDRPSDERRANCPRPSGFIGGQLPRKLTRPEMRGCPGLLVRQQWRSA